MSYRYRDKKEKSGVKGDAASSHLPRQYSIGPRSKTMIDETPTSRQRALKKETEESPGLQRKYGSARYQRSATTDLSGIPSSVHKSSAASRYTTSGRTSPLEKSFPHERYHGVGTRESSSAGASIFSRPSYDTSLTSYTPPPPKYVPSTASYSPHLHNVGRDRPTYSALQYYSPHTKDRLERTFSDPTKDASRTKASQYSSTTYSDRERFSPSPDFTKRYDASHSRSSSAGSSHDSGSPTRKTSYAKDRRVLYIGGYSGQTSPEDSSRRDTSYLSRQRTFDSSISRRGSEPLSREIRAPFIRTSSLRDRDYPSKYHQRQVSLERKSSLPAHIMLREHRKSESERRSPVPETVPEERSRKGSWLKTRKKASESENTEKAARKRRADSTSPGSGKSRFSLSGKSSPSSDNSEGTLRKKFSVPSKYFSSSKETVGSSRDSATSDGSTELLDTEDKPKKKHSLPAKFSFRKRGSSSERAISAKSESAPATPSPSSPVMDSKVRTVRTLSADAEHDRSFAVMIGRLRFWDKKQKVESGSRSRSPDGRQRAESSPAEVEGEPPGRPPLPSDSAMKGYSTLPYASKSSRVLSKARSFDSGQEAYMELRHLDQNVLSDSDKMKSWTKVEIVSKRVEKEVAELIKTADEIEETPRERRRAQYRRTADIRDNAGFSKSMDASVNVTKTRSTEKEPALTKRKAETVAAVEQKPRAESVPADKPAAKTSSEKLREKRRRRRLERENFFASMSPPASKKESWDSVDASVSDTKMESSGVVGNGRIPSETGKPKTETPRPGRLVLKVSKVSEETRAAPTTEATKPIAIEAFPGDILNRYISEDDTSRTLLDKDKKKEERPHSICGGSLSPDEMKAFEDINFSLARKTSSDELSNLRPKKRWSTSSEEVHSVQSDVGRSLDRDQPLTVLAQVCEVEKRVVVRSKEIPKVEVQTVRKTSGGQEKTDGHLKSFFKKKTSVASNEKDKKKVEKEKEKCKAKEKEKEREKEKVREVKEERERKEKEKHRHKEEERLKKEREKEEREKEKQKQREEEKERKEKEKHRSKGEKKDPEKESQNEKHTKKEKIHKEDEKEQNLQEKDNKELENKERETLEKKEKKEKKERRKKRDPERRRSEVTLEIKSFSKSSDIKEPNEESDLPRAGSVSALLTVFNDPTKPLKPAIRYTRKKRPQTLAVGIAPEILKAARAKIAFDEKMPTDKTVTHDDFYITTGSSREEDQPKDSPDVELVLQPLETGGGEEDNKTKESKKAVRLKKQRKGSTTRPFGMMKTKSESNLNDRFELIQVDIPLDDERERKPEKQPAEERKVGKVIELRPVSKVVIPSAVSQLMVNRLSGKKPADTVEQSIEEINKQTGFDEGLEAFFGNAQSKETQESSKQAVPKIEITSEDLDAISVQSTTHLKSAAEDKLHLKPKRRHASKANPIKTLRERTDLKTDTEPPSPRIEKKAVTSDHPVIRRKKKKYKDPENLWRRHTVDFAASALAGLQSTEDFTKIALRKTGGPEKAKEQDNYRGTKPIMLLHIKGRRNIQTRMVEPCQKSFNSGDCYVLVTKEELFAWVGKQANAIERAKVTEIASRIFTKRELDCKARDIVFIEEKHKDDPDNLGATKRFWKVLNGDPDDEIRAAESLPKDEEYEKGITKTNMVYKVHWSEPPTLSPVETMCGHLPQIAVLDTKEVLIFDFGSELYIWNGQQSLSGQRKIAFALGKQLYEAPFKPLGIYDPIYPYGRGSDANDTKGRPPWTLIARLHEKAETILFREKFLDWPDPTKIIKMKGHPSSGEGMRPLVIVELKPCDPKSLVSFPEPFKGESLEGVNVGRGKGVPTVWTGDYYKEGNLCNTIGVTVWHINEYRHYELPQQHHGHFHSGEGYVIRWAYYVITDRIATDRKSRCRSTIAGRVRTAYFFWQGNDCTVNEKGAAAVMAVELDEERGPQIRVTQGKEPPCFLNLFKGGMVIHFGNATKGWFDSQERDHVTDTAEKLSDSTLVRLYAVRNEEPGEGCLVQVRPSCLSLRSRGCVVLLLCKEGKLFVWYGCKTLDETRKNALVAAKSIQAKKPVECNIENVSAITIEEVEEGQEPEELLEALGGKKYYCSLLNDPSTHHFTPRLFELGSATGKFMACEVLCPSRVDAKLCPFPFLQDDLYTTKQPGLFILDNHFEVYVWEGWIPEDDIDSLTGTGKQRWDNDRKLAMETAIKYAEEVGKRVSHRVFVVHAGLEPMSFKAAFPHWNDKQYVLSIQKQTGKQPGAKELVSELLQTFTKDSYSLEELQQIPPPQGIDPAKLETYLSTADFQEVFKMGKEEFAKLPGWKQQNLKKAVKLF